MSVASGNLPVSKRLEQDFSVLAVLTPNAAMTGLPATAEVRQIRGTSSIKVMTPNIAVTPGGVAATAIDFTAGLLVPFRSTALRTETRYYHQGTNPQAMAVTINPNGDIRYTPGAALVLGTAYVFPSQLFEWPADTILSVAQ